MGRSRSKAARRRADAASADTPGWMGFSHSLSHKRKSWLRFVGQRPLCREGLYNVEMNEASFNALSAWLIQAGLAGTSETDIVSGFCDRCVAAGIPLGRAQLFIDTLHPVHEGRLFRWGMVLANLHCSNTAAPARPRSLRPAPIPRMSRPPSGGGAARSIRCCKPASRCCAAGSVP